MKLGRLILVASLWAASLVGVAVWAQGNNPAPAPAPGNAVRAGQPIGPIITAENIGFQPVAGEARRGTIPGRFMIRVNGEWFQASAPSAVVPATLP